MFSGKHRFNRNVFFNLQYRIYYLLSHFAYLIKRNDKPDAGKKRKRRAAMKGTETDGAIFDIFGLKQDKVTISNECK